MFWNAIGIKAFFPLNRSTMDIGSAEMSEKNIKNDVQFT